MFNFQFGRDAYRLCNGVSRRHTLRLGATSLLGGMSLPHLLRAADDSAATGQREAKTKACLFIFLEGGPPQIDMWDPKPEAPSEIRGPFNAISTALPGIQFGEHCRP